MNFLAKKNFLASKIVALLTQILRKRPDNPSTDILNLPGVLKSFLLFR